MAISADGDVFAWGWNSRATLGHGHRDPVPKPRRVAGLRGVPIVQVALGGWHALYLDNEGQVWASGGDEYMQSGQGAKERDVLVPTMCLPALRVCSVSAGGMHSLALTEDGQLWTWGEPWGSYSMTIDRRPRRVEVEDPEEIIDRGGFVAIACGAFHNLALTSTGEIYSWGLNDYGQLGLGHTASVTAPQRIVDGLDGVAAADISCGGWHSGLLSTKGEVYMFGRGEYGRLGMGDKSGSSKLRPTKIRALEGVKMVQLSCGGSHTMGVDADGKAWAWGRGSFGRLGTGEQQRDALSPVEINLPGGPERWHVIAVAAGGRHSLVFALPDNGEAEERLSAGWQRRRSPMGLSPQSSGIRLATAFSPGEGSGMAARRGRHSENQIAAAGGGGSTDMRHRDEGEEDGDDELGGSSSDLSGETPESSIELGFLAGDGEIEVEDALNEAPTIQGYSDPLSSSLVYNDGTGVVAAPIVGTPVELLIMPRVAELSLRERHGGRSPSPQGVSPQGEYVDLNQQRRPSMIEEGEEGDEGEEEEEKEDKEEKEGLNELDEGEEMGTDGESVSDGSARPSREVRRAASSAAAMMHGLRDDLMDDRS